MKKLLFHLSLIAILVSMFSENADAQRRRQIFDGPYVKKQEDVYKLMWIQKGRKKTTEIPVGTDTIWTVENLPKVDLTRLDVSVDTEFEYNGVSKFAAISDVHGQYDLMISLLRTHGVIDSLNNWIYGDGHLVVLGDIFDRGDKVTECLWFLFFLEKQAAVAGGKLHFLLGNHELMILHGNYTYLNPKYIFTTGLSDTPYAELFAPSTILGQWLRSKKISISINDFVFVHGGFSERIIEQESSIRRINSLFTNSILPNPDIEKDTTNLISELYFDNGPLWYRGYVMAENFDLNKAEYILNKLGKESIVIGHTSMPQIFSLFCNRIVLIDSSIKFGNSGELLLYENDILYRAKANGQTEVIKCDDSGEGEITLFDYIYEVAGDDLKVVIQTDVDSLLENKMDEEYYRSLFTIYETGEELYSFDSRVRTRGNMRKKLCNLPPLKLDFKKSLLRNFKFSSHDKLKLVLQCLPNPENEHYLYKEYLIYKLYGLVDTLSLKAKMIDLELLDNLGESRALKAFVLEDEEVLARRIEGQIVEKGVVRSGGLHRESYLKLAFFQFMIANSDWSISARHNIKTIKLDSLQRMKPMPYDFDYAGIVNQKYAVPDGSFPVMNMDEAKLRLTSITKEETEWILDFYNSIRDDVFDIIESADYLDDLNRNEFRESVINFYRIINSRKHRKLYFPIQD